jgi:hypothetical protein
MPADRAPGVLIQFVDPPPAIQPARVDVPVLVCVAERGPVGLPVRCGSWTAFEATFGGFVPNGLGAYAAKAFFDNGGTVAWVVRVAAPTRIARTTGAQPADRRRSLLDGVAGLVPGAVATLSQAEARHDYLVVAADPGTGLVTWDRPLHPDFDLTVTVDVATGAGVAFADLPGAGGAPGLRVHAGWPRPRGAAADLALPPGSPDDTLAAEVAAGAWGGRLQVVVSPGERVTTTSRPHPAAGPVTTPVVTTAGFRIGERCRISQDVGGVVATTVAEVAAVDGPGRLLTWTAALPASIDPTQPFTVEGSTFALAVLLDDAVVELWPDLSVVDRHPRYAERVLRGSAYLRAEVVGSAQPVPVRRRLGGGRDGTAALAVDDLLGDEVLGDGIGLAAAVDLAEPAVVVVPDLVAAPTPARVVDPPPPPDPCDPCADPGEPVPERVEVELIEAGASFDDDHVAAAQQRLIESCERNTERVVLLDPPHTARNLTALRAWAVRFSSSYALAVAPWLTVVEPGRPATVRAVPAGGHLAGLIARCDAEDGPWLSPANRSLAWAHGLTIPLTDAEHAVANDDGINLVRALPGRGLVPLGSRTLSPDALWTFIAVRRAMIHLRRTLRLHLAWVPFEPNSAALASALTSAIGTLLTDVWEAGGLAGARAADAFVVATDQSRAAVGELLIVVGVALARPAEFVTVRVSKTGNRLEITEQPTLVLAGA